MMHTKEVITAGENIQEASKALIMIHGRGAAAADILSLASHLHIADYALFAPQATNHTWYPQSFLAPAAMNEPWLGSALGILDEVVQDIIQQGIGKEHIYFTGFSQGACLMLEYITRNATRYGGAAAFTGGLIGDKIYPEKYKGDFAGTPVFIGTSNPDPHVPVERVYATANILKDMNADVTEKIYENMGHTINFNEIELANSLVFDL